jgi:hypothetical protein
MPGAGVEAVPLARVYDALDAESYRAFRAAMRRSRGGVVRAADLLAGLAETQPRDTAAVLELEPAEVTFLARQPASEPDLVPMANEPALREALATAYRQAGGSPVTAAVLLRALAPHHPRRAPMARPATVPGPSRPAAPAQGDGEQVVNVLGQWLSAQSMPPAQREAEIGRINLGTRTESRTRP